MSNTRKERILLVDSEPEKILGWLKLWLVKYDISIHTAESGIQALVKYNKYLPGLILIAADLPDMSGMTLSSIIKDSQSGKNTVIYLYNLKEIMQNTKADFFFNATSEEKFCDALHAQIVNFYNVRFMHTNHSMEIMRAIAQQYEKLPMAYEGKYFSVTPVFSAYGELSGDSYDYWEDESGNLYGLLFDCTGHDFLSFSQVSNMRTLLKKDMRMYEMNVYRSLSEVLETVNSDLFAVDQEPENPVAIVFKLDIVQGVFEYSTAGIPGIIVKRRGEKNSEVLDASSFMLGDLTNATFDNYCIGLADVEEITVCSDGLYELTYNKEVVEDSQIAKHDDVSAIILQFKDELSWIARLNAANSLEKKEDNGEAEQADYAEDLKEC